MVKSMLLLTCVELPLEMFAGMGHVSSTEVFLALSELFTMATIATLKLTRNAQTLTKPRKPIILRIRRHDGNPENNIKNSMRPGTMTRNELGQGIYTLCKPLNLVGMQAVFQNKIIHEYLPISFGHIKKADSHTPMNQYNIICW